MTEPRSRTGRQLSLAAHAAGWTVHITPGHGTTEQSYLGDPRGDGTRPRLTRTVECQSEGIRLRSPDRARNAVAVLYTLDGQSWTTHGVWTWTTGNLPTETSPRALLALLRAQTDTEETTAA